MLTSVDEDVPVFPIRQNPSPNPHQSQSRSKMRQNRTQGTSGSVTKLCFLVIGKQDLGAIIYRDVIKHPVVHVTDWRHITRTDSTGENVHLLIPAKYEI